jgi:hypothetical protein
MRFLLEALGFVPEGVAPAPRVATDKQVVGSSATLDAQGSG